MDGPELDADKKPVESKDDLMGLDNPGVNNAIRAVTLSYEALR